MIQLGYKLCSEEPGPADLVFRFYQGEVVPKVASLRGRRKAA